MYRTISCALALVNLIFLVYNESLNGYSTNDAWFVSISLDEEAMIILIYEHTLTCLYFTYFSVLILNSYSYSILYFVLFLYPSLHLHAHLQVHILVLLTLLILNLNLNTHLVTIHWMYTVKSELSILNIPFVLHVFFSFTNSGFCRAHD